MVWAEGYARFRKLAALPSLCERKLTTFGKHEAPGFDNLRFLLSLPIPFQMSTIATTVTRGVACVLHERILGTPRGVS